ncbi:type III-B CRISPR module RAMP protein Cmr4 [Candidatus Venteria ishoeyi]|uniref:RAMP superfamily protein n=1 Tax=Candidatus Venteria ishoeyi TaxID=1899563 RepID=A0A1H6F528_9GAMM|nr:type III-B CRISPR module RAMP protein Cmr4 [Candidatus Venteria ishoeyi]SEH05258.1 RAMP superfamily protein [Candidatus Venteria ishoeyi]
MKTAILGLMTHTPLHAGSGQDMGIIDLPIQREEITQWPCVYGSSMKGALRCHAEGVFDKPDERVNVNLIFGPDADTANKEKGSYAGALNVGDARLLLFPVRSLQGTFRWVCCPANIQRLLRDIDYLQLADNFPQLAKIKLDSLDLNNETGGCLPAFSHEPAAKVYLEEYCFNTMQQPLENIIALIARFVDNRPEFVQQLQEKLLLIQDEQFAYLVQHATPVHAHNILDDQKTSQNLWYEETLAPETLLYAPLQATDTRQKGSDKKADWVLENIETALKHPWLQVGGNETVGMGWCAVTLLQGVA